MEDLNKYQELTDINFDGENPHSAICHYSQGYSANGCHTALLLKSDKPAITEELLKSLGEILPEEEVLDLTKSSNNKRNMLEEVITDYLRANMSNNGEYVYTYVQDYNESLFIFSFQNKLWVAAYNESEDGVVTLDEGFEIQSATRRDLYVNSKTGEELIKASDWLKKVSPDLKGDLNPEQSEEISKDSNGVMNGETQEIETQDTPLETKEEVMSTETNIEKEEVVVEKSVDIQEIMKSAEAQELIKAAIEAHDAAREAEELEKSTVELMKGYEVVSDEDAEALAKAVLCSEASDLILKAFGDFQAEVKKAKNEAEQVKKEFGEKQNSLESQPVIQKGRMTREQMKEIVAQQKAAQSK